MALKRFFSQHSQYSTRNAVVLEQCESRCFQSTTYYSSLASLGGSGSYSSSFLLGDNGDEWGDPTLYMGAGNTTIDMSYFAWGTVSNGGLAGYTVDTSLAVNTTSSHVATWTVGQNTLGSDTVAPSTSVHSVTLGAKVFTSGLEFKFSNIVVTFFNSNGTAVESVSVANVSANTRNGGPSSAESAAVVTPSAGTASGAQVTAKMSMNADAGTYPNSGDIFGKIAIA